MPTSSSTTQPIYYVYNYPVIERVVDEVRYIQADGPQDFTQQLNDLYQRIQAQIHGLNISTNTQFAQQYQVIAQTNNIDQLGSITISDSTFSAGTISGSTLTDIVSLSVSGGTTLGGVGATDITASGNITATGSGTFSDITATSTSATSTFAGGILATRAPTQPHTFASWTTGTTNSAFHDAALVINPASAVGDSNLLSAAVSGSVKFLVDAEGDVFVNNLTSVGSVTLSTTSASSFNVEGSTTLGDSITDTTTINGTLTVTGTTTASTVSGKFGVGTTTPWGRFSVLSADNSSDPQFVVASSSAIGLIFNKSGYFGIGTSSPTNKLEVSGNTFLGGNLTATGTFSVAGATTLANSTSTNLHVSSSLTASYASSTQGFFGSLSVGSLSGFLKATAGVVSAALVDLASDVTGILPVANGGTGWASIAAGAIPYGNGSSALATTTAGTNGYVLAYLNGAPTWTATTTFSAPLSYSGGAVSIPAASGSTSGYLSSSDYTTFSAKVGTSRAVNTTYPLQGGGDLSADRALSLAFGTTTSNTWSALQLFTAASSTQLSVFSKAHFGGTATSTFDSAGALSLVSNGLTVGTSQLVVSAGNVGIGNTSPSYKLDVTGYINTDQYSGYKQNGTSILFASTTVNGATLVGANTPIGSLQSTSFGAVAVGYGALRYATTTNNYSVAVGYEALKGAATNGSTGSTNTAVGGFALTANTTGYENTAVGGSALTANTTGYENTAVGGSALSSNTTGAVNTAVGKGALAANTTGAANIALGHSALNAMTTGGTNIGIGYQGGYGITTGSNNIALGWQSMFTSSTGGNNLGIGNATLRYNTTGGDNVALGYGASWYNASATSTVTVGAYAGRGISSTFSNQGSTAVGYQSGYNFNSGSDYNTLLGYQAGYDITTGANNLILGSEQTTGSGITTGSNNILLGKGVRYGLSQTGSNQLNIGNLIFGTDLGSGTTLGTGNVGIGTASPTTTLHVQGNILSSENNMPLAMGSANGAAPTIGHNLLPSLTTGGQWNYVTSDTGAMIQFDGGQGAFVFRSAPSGTAGAVASLNTLMNITTAGNVGIGTTSPWRKLSVTGTVGFDGLTGSTGAGSLCLTASKEVVYNSGSDACLPSLRDTKHDITALSLDALRIVDALDPVSFVYNDGDGRLRYGFIAEDTAAVDSHLVTYSASGTLSGIDDRSIIAVIVKAIKELWDRLNEYFSRTEQLEARVTALEAQLAAVNAGGGSASSPSPSGSDPDVEAPSITVNGNNPAILKVGDTYNDLGASVTDNVGQNLGLKTYLNGVLVIDIVLDTDTAGEHSIDYVATDNAGNTATSTRTVIIEAPSIVPPDTSVEEVEAEEANEDELTADPQPTSL